MKQVLDIKYEAVRMIPCAQACDDGTEMTKSSISTLKGTVRLSTTTASAAPQHHARMKCPKVWTAHLHGLPIKNVAVYMHKHGHGVRQRFNAREGKHGSRISDFRSWS